MKTYTDDFKRDALDYVKNHPDLSCKHDVGIDSSDNLVRLKNRFHNRLHRKSYFKGVNIALKRTDKLIAKTKGAFPKCKHTFIGKSLVKTALRRIKTVLLLANAKAI